MNWLLRKMGLKDKVENQIQNKISSTLITKEEAAFVITKLRQADYKGSEFEQFYQVMAKLSDIVGKK
jgi:hypothetical protein